MRAYPIVAAILLVPALAQAEPVTVTYSMSVAGLPIGSAKLVITPNGDKTALAVTGSLGGPFELGRMAASATIAPGQINVSSQTGSGAKATTASLVSKGAPGNSSFSYSGKTTRGPASVALILSGNRVTREDVNIPDNPQAVRVPVTEAHKSGVIDPVSLLALLVKPGSLMAPEGLCGKTVGIFTGQARFNLIGTAAEPASVRGLPQGWSAVSCKVTHAPISGHRIDKGQDGGKVRTGTVVFARAPSQDAAVLWSVSAPAPVGSFALTASSVQ